MTINLPPDLENRLADEARRLGTTPELLAVESLRSLFVSPAVDTSAVKNGTLFDYLAGYVGAISGANEPLSEDCGRRFTDGLAERQERGRL